jgi:hypothetical protein
MRVASYIRLGAAIVALVATACTFGANDFKVVPSDGGPNGTGGIGGTGGAAPNGGTSNGGGGGVQAVTCGHQGNVFTIFSASDLRTDLDENRDARYVLAQGSNGAFAVASMTPENNDAGRTDGRILIRPISDNSTSPLRSLVAYTATGHVRVGSVWATDTDLTIVAVDELGIFRLDIPLNGADPNLSALTRTSVFTPPMCIGSGGGVHSLHAVNEGGFRYVITCFAGTQYSLWRGTMTTAEQIGTTGPGIELIARKFIAHGTQDLIVCGPDGPDLEVPYRVGTTAAELAVTHPMRMSNAAGDYSAFQFTQFPNGAGAFVVAAKMKDPAGATVLPAELYAGSVPQAQYPTLTTVPPTQLTRFVTYTTATDVLYPTSAALLGNPPGMRAIVAEIDILVRHHVYVTPFAGDGTPLAGAFEVTPPGDTTVQVDRAAIARVGVGLIVAWVQNAGEADVRGRGVVCL